MKRSLLLIALDAMRVAMDESLGHAGVVFRNAIPELEAELAKTPYTLEEVHSFLNGEGTLDGVTFGEGHPIVLGNFWWRKYLAAAIEAERAEQTSSR